MIYFFNKIPKMFFARKNHMWYVFFKLIYCQVIPDLHDQVGLFVTKIQTQILSPVDSQAMKKFVSDIKNASKNS